MYSLGVSPSADGIVVMIFVTRLLKRTVGEDNEKTEMYVHSALRVEECC